MTIYLEDMGEVTFPFEPEEQIEKLAAFVTDFVKCPYEPEISVTLVTKEEIHEQLEQQGALCSFRGRSSARHLLFPRNQKK